MRDFTAGHISTEEANGAVGDGAGTHRAAIGCSFIPGVSYRNLLIYRGAKQPAPFTHDTRATPPHDLTDKSVLDDYPRGPGSDVLNRLMSESVGVFRRSSGERRPPRGRASRRPRTSGCGAWAARRGCSRLQKLYGVRGAMITAVDLLRGLAALVGLAADRSARRDRLSRHRLRRQGPLRHRRAAGHRFDLRPRRSDRRSLARRATRRRRSKRSRRSTGTSSARCTRP